MALPCPLPPFPAKVLVTLLSKLRLGRPAPRARSVSASASPTAHPPLGEGQRAVLVNKWVGRVGRPLRRARRAPSDYPFRVSDACALWFQGAAYRWRTRVASRTRAATPTAACRPSWRATRRCPRTAAARRWAPCLGSRWRAARCGPRWRSRGRGPRTTAWASRTPASAAPAPRWAATAVSRRCASRRTAPPCSPAPACALRSARAPHGPSPHEPLPVTTAGRRFLKQDLGRFKPQDANVFVVSMCLSWPLALQTFGKKWGSSYVIKQILYHRGETKLSGSRMQPGWLLWNGWLWTIIV